MPKQYDSPRCVNGQQDRFRMILENVRDFAIFSADLQGRINEWNPGAERFFGYTQEEILGQPMEILYVPEDRAIGRAELEKAQAAKTGFSEDERWHLRKDGTRFFVSGAVNAMYDEGGKLCGFIKVARDITSRKTLQDRLENSEAQHRMILEAIKDFAIMTLDLDGTIKSWNPGAVLTFGYEQEEVIGKNHALLFTAEDQGAGEPEQRISEALREGISQEEHWLVNKNGERIYTIDVLRPMTDPHGHGQAILKVSRDITTRQMTKLKLEATQRELKKTQAELEQKVAHRTAALEQSVQSLEKVLDHVAHDLRAPLRTMEGFSSILVRKYGPEADPEAKRLSDMISEAARRMDRLIHDLLTFGRLCHEPVKREQVSLSPVIEATLAQLDSQIRAAGAEIQLSPSLPLVWADQSVLRQVLKQLINNALVFVVVGRSPKMRFWTELRDKCVRLWIEDNGIGIAPEYLDRIFWLFERLSQENASSTGMGLSIARKGVERMEGRIGVESEQGTGSRFWIELPAVEVPS